MSGVGLPGGGDRGNAGDLPKGGDLPSNVELDDAEMEEIRRWFGRRRQEPVTCPFCGDALTLDRTLRHYPSYAPGPDDTWALAVFGKRIATVALRCSECGHLMEFDLETVRRSRDGAV